MISEGVGRIFTNQRRDIQKLDCVMPYDHISYFRPVIEANDYEILIESIENSNNNHYKRFLLLLIRRCGMEGEKSWENWIKGYISKFPTQITSYPEFTVVPTKQCRFGNTALSCFVNT